MYMRYWHFIQYVNLQTIWQIYIYILYKFRRWSKKYTCSNKQKRMLYSSILFLMNYICNKLNNRFRIKDLQVLSCVSNVRQIYWIKEINIVRKRKIQIAPIWYHNYKWKSWKRITTPQIRTFASYQCYSMLK